MKASLVLIVPPDPASLPQGTAGFFPNIASVREKTLASARSLPHLGRVSLWGLSQRPAGAAFFPGLLPTDQYRGVPEQSAWSRKTILHEIVDFFKEEEGEQAIWWLWADTPLLDLSLAERLWTRHTRWRADYTHTDGWPQGFAPELISLSALRTLAWLAREDETPVDRDLLFAVVQKDINNFDIETELASADLRPRRLHFFADSRRNWLLIERFLSHGYTRVEDTLRFVEEHPLDLMTLPAFVQIETNAACPTDCPICPWPSYSLARFGEKPSERTEMISVEDFSLLLDKIVAFAGDAVIDISLWGEPALHPNIEALARAVFARPSLSLIIESSGIGWREGSIEAIVAAAAESSPRTGLISSKRPGVLSWIISLDAQSPERYALLRGEGFAEARATAERIYAQAPRSLWVQALRLDDGVEDLEAFWKEWKERGVQTIVQKYDWFSAFLPQRRAADLSPLKRLPCWHLMRDLVIFHDGELPICREDMGRTVALGNVLKDDLEELWEKRKALVTEHIGMTWPKVCVDCDEYYTWNY